MREFDINTAEILFKFRPLMGFSVDQSKHSERGRGAENKLNIKSNIQYELGRKTLDTT